MAQFVSSVPYDVVSDAEVRELTEANPHSFLRVTRPLAESGEQTAELNKKARRHLKKMIADGVLVTDEDEAIYVYRLGDGAHVQTGIVACCSLDEYEKGIIKRHEKTRPDKVEDRTSHMLELGAQTGLIFLAYRGTTATRVLIEDETTRTPLYNFECEKGIRQTIWKAAKTQELVAAFADVPTIYIADGHHRAESALRAREAMKQKNPHHTGNEEYNFVIAGIFPAEDLRILAYNRVVRDPNGLSEEEFLSRVSDNFVITDSGETVPQDRAQICMYLSGKWLTLRFAVDFIQAPDPIESLDVSILQNYILAPVLGVGDPRTDERIAFVGGIRGTAELEAIVDRGEARVAFSLFPTTMSDLFAVSDMDAIMPPKSTWFEPKLKDGLLVHVIE